VNHRELVDCVTSALAGHTSRRIENWAVPLKQSAVAVLLVERDGQTWVPLIERGATAPTHSGQIALPGGGFDISDMDLVATACREAHEELGIPRDAPRILGTLDDVPTPTGYAITPVVAELDPAIEFVPDPREIAGWFFGPLSIFFDRSTVEVLGVREWNGAKYTMRAYHYGDYRIWGATARILEALVELAGGPPRE